MGECWLATALVEAWVRFSVNVVDSSDKGAEDDEGDAVCGVIPTTPNISLTQSVSEDADIYVGYIFAAK